MSKDTTEVDTVIVGGGILRDEKLTPVSAFGAAFNISQHVAWIRSRRLLKG